MIEERVRTLLSMEYENRLLIHEKNSFSSVVDYAQMLIDAGYEVILYDDIEAFRLTYENNLRGTKAKAAIISRSHIYIPYDIKKAFYEVELSLDALYPKLNSAVLLEHLNDIELIDYVYDSLYEDQKTEAQTRHFIEQRVLTKAAISPFIAARDADLLKEAKNASSYLDWISIAKKNAKLGVNAASIGEERSPLAIDNEFECFIFDGYPKLSGVVAKNSPSILPKAIDMIAGGKAAIIVADGMSLFDFEIMSKYFSDFEYDYNCSFAMIPTTTSISRQSLLSGKYPQQLSDPFSLAKEESGFYNAASEHGYTKQQTFYARGYDALPGPLVRFAAIIINDIDDMVHGQMQGRQGMFNDVTLLAKTGKLQSLICSLLESGFSVYLTADHGNTHCVGGGSIKRTGVETETKSKRMIVLKDFAEVSDDLRDRTIVYPGYYMDKSYQYMICKGDTSFDNKGEDVMTHGGISIEEVIVPFIKIRSKHNG